MTSVLSHALYSCDLHSNEISYYSCGLGHATVPRFFIVKMEIKTDYRQGGCEGLNELRHVEGLEQWYISHSIEVLVSIPASLLTRVFGLIAG